MRAIVIAPAGEPDREWAAQLMARSDPWVTLGRRLDACRKICNDSTELLYIGRVESSPRGFILMRRRGVAGSPYIASVAVTEDCRGQGIGSELLRFAENLFHEEARHIFLCVSSFNPLARSLYERCGYRAVGELPDYILKGSSEILMHKRLQ